MTKLKDIAKACKSKNAGPFELTLDIMFDSAETFERVRRTGVITRERIAALYGVAPEDVLFTEYPPALAYKATLPRRIVSGAIGDTDVYGAQQHAPLLDLELPL
ncbi:DUF4387 domain-containing protein [Bordetella bronchialis]|uniref:Acyl-CoA synthetase n=1 Tax=Bordetella bronchialis TaxID=463025 RepID=A0A193FW85_9BORD|nr:DUF4387 domain-containing protein [Bordetella bronchialis]ANN66536.1 acyl-CoA synthetase [Bordetella bronchialis]ANN71613.1 acyl-CoA synthetase [Bordetella bronchialis]